MEITNSELSILGLLSEGEQYGYQLEQEIERRGMRAWTEIAFSSIYYVLNQLEKARLLAGERQQTTDRPARKVYRLTPAGREVLRVAVQQRLASPRPRTADFDLALANLPVLSAVEARRALITYQAALIERLEQVRAKRELDRQAGLPPHVEALFAHSLAQLQAELDWLRGFIQQYDQNIEDSNG